MLNPNEGEKSLRLFRTSGKYLNHATQQSRAPRVAMASLSPMTAAMSRGFARDPPPPSLAEPLLPRSTPPTGHARRRRDDDDDDASSDSNAVARGAALPLTPPRRDAAFGDVAVSAASDAETDDGFVPWADATPFAYVALVLCVALAAARLGDVRDARSPALLSMALLALAGAMQPLLCASLTKARRAGYLDFYLSSRRAFRAPFAIASVGTATACLASILLGVFVDPEDGASASTLIRVPDRIARALLPGYQTRAPSPFVVASATAFVAFGFECVALLIALGVIIARTRRHRRAGTPPDAKSALNPPNAAGDDDDDDETGRARGGWSPSFDFKRGVRRGETTESVSDAQAELNRYMCDQVSELGREVLRLRRVVARRETVARGVGHARAMAASAATTSQVAAAAAGDATPAEAVTRAAHAAALNLVQAELKATRAELARREREASRLRELDFARSEEATRLRRALEEKERRAEEAKSAGAAEEKEEISREAGPGPASGEAPAPAVPPPLADADPPVSPSKKKTYPEPKRVTDAVAKMNDAFGMGI